MQDMITNSLVTSIVRTIVPYLVGTLAGQGLVLTDDSLTAISSVLAFLIGIGYYVVVRLLGKKWPKAEYLLGVPSKPIYKEIK